MDIAIAQPQDQQQQQQQPDQPQQPQQQQQQQQQPQMNQQQPQMNQQQPQQQQNQQGMNPNFFPTPYIDQHHFAQNNIQNSNNNTNPLNISATQPMNQTLPYIQGMIPLVPLEPTPGTATPALPLELTDAQLHTLSTESREAIQQRLQLLETTQQHIFQVMQTLTQALSVIPLGSPRSEPQPTEQDTPAESSTSRKGKEKCTTAEPSTSTAVHADEDTWTEIKEESQ
jgi:hypothetical protein